MMWHKTLIILLAIIFLPACSRPNLDISSTSDLNMKKHIIIAETQYYKVNYLNSLYEYYIYDKNHNIVKSEKFLSRQPHLSMVNNDTVKFTLQSGTGIETQWGYYYNVTNNVFSQIYNSIYDQSDDKVAYGGRNKVIVSDIFHETSYYREIGAFKHPLSKMANPISKVEFIDNGRNIKILYFSGDNYKEVYEIFDLETITQ